MRSATRRALTLASLIGLCLAASLWLWQQPVGLPSDDALYFVRGVSRFSVLELSPHFPGYPAFVLLGRAFSFWLDPLHALHAASMLASLALAPLCFLWVFAATSNRAIATWAAGAMLLQPLFPSLALSLLSDGLGVACVLAYLWLVARERWGWAGVALGLCVAARPSYAVIVLAAWGCLALFARPRLWRVAGGFCAILVPMGLFVWQADGFAYVTEGIRFVSGHFQIWGAPGVASTRTWGQALLSLVGGVPGGVCGAVLGGYAARHIELRAQSVCAAAVCMVAHLAWTLGAQNADHVRHLAPVVVLGLGLLALALARDPRPARAVGVGMAATAWLACVAWAEVDFVPRPPPLARAVALLRTLPPNQWILVRRGVDVLRVSVPEQRIVDAHYAASAAAVVRRSSAQPTYWLRGVVGADSSSSDDLSGGAACDPAPISGVSHPMWCRAIARFPGRFPGEVGLELALVVRGSAVEKPH